MTQVCHWLPLSRCGYYWPCGLHPQQPDTLPGAPTWTQDGQSWTRCYKVTWQLRTSYHHNNDHPPKESESVKWRAEHSLLGAHVLLKTYLLDVSVVGTIDELLQLSQAVGFSQGKDQLRLNVGLTSLFTSHLQELHQVLPVSCKQAKNKNEKANSVYATS